MRRAQRNTVAELMDLGRTVLTVDDVMPEVPEMLHLVKVEATFPDGTKLVSCHDPIQWPAASPVPSPESGVPRGQAPSAGLGTRDARPTQAQRVTGDELPPPSAAAGEVWRPLPRYVLRDEPVAINDRWRSATLRIENTGDRPVQVGSHCHFFEANHALRFEREAARGMRLNIPVGTTAPWPHRVHAGSTRSAGCLQLVRTLPRQAPSPAGRGLA